MIGEKVNTFLLDCVEEMIPIDNNYKKGIYTNQYWGVIEERISKIKG